MQGAATSSGCRRRLNIEPDPSRALLRHCTLCGLLVDLSPLVVADRTGVRRDSVGLGRHCWTGKATIVVITSAQPQPGSKWTKNGIEFTIHAVENGQVYGVRYREDDTDDSSLYLPPDEWTIPTGCLGPVRITLEDFWKAVEGVVPSETYETSTA